MTLYPLPIYPCFNLIKSNLCRLLVRIYVLEEAAIHIVGLLLDNSTKLHQLVRNRLVGTLEDVDETIPYPLAFSPLKAHRVAFEGTTYDPECALSWMVNMVIASPVLPALPVRPIR